MSDGATPLTSHARCQWPVVQSDSGRNRVAVVPGLPEPTAEDQAADVFRKLRVRDATGAISLQVWIDAEDGLANEAVSAAFRQGVATIAEVARVRCGRLEERFHEWLDRWCSAALDGTGAVASPRFRNPMAGAVVIDRDVSIGRFSSERRVVVAAVRHHWEDSEGAGESLTLNIAVGPDPIRDPRPEIRARSLVRPRTFS